MRKILLCFLILIFLNVSAQKYQANWASLDSRPVPAWFTDGKLGIFIHWGVYSVPAWAPVGKQWATYSKYSEWYWNRWLTDSSNVGKAFREYHNKTYGPNFQYQDFAPMFKAELFNADQWAEVMKNSGAQYVVLTSKHHDGFALWPSAESWNWNAVDVGPHRDLAGELTRAVKGKGMHMGFYYSLYEWFNPLYKSDVNKYVDQHMLPQLKDLVNRYQPDVIWPDGEWEHPSKVWRSEEFLAWLYNESAVKNTVVVNDRWGKETRSKHGGYYTTEYDIVHNADATKTKFTHPWEECRGIGGSFGFNRNENLADYESSDAVVKMLVQKVARGGNLLLDIGPAADGTIPVIMQQRLADLGAWLKVNGESIYGTTTVDLNLPAGVMATRKGRDLYLFASGEIKDLKVPVRRKASSIQILGSTRSVTSRYAGRVHRIKKLKLPALNVGGTSVWVMKLSNVY